MPFKVVQTIANGELLITICPDNWESGGKLFWPSMVQGEKLIAKIMNCVVKRANLTLEEAQAAVDAKSYIYETLEEENTVTSRKTKKIKKETNKTATSSLNNYKELELCITSEPAPRPAACKRASKPALNNSKKKNPKEESSEESEGEEDEEVEDEEGDLDEEEGSNGSDGNKSDSSQSKDVPKHFHSENFVLLKSDVKWDGDTVVSKLDEINLWKIAGKPLLQKYIPMESNGKVLHKCTCVYTGWNVDNRENYYPITEILDRNPRTDSKEICVALTLKDLLQVKDK